MGDPNEVPEGSQAEPPPVEPDVQVPDVPVPVDAPTDTPAPVDSEPQPDQASPAVSQGDPDVTDPPQTVDPESDSTPAYDPVADGVAPDPLAADPVLPASAQDQDQTKVVEKSRTDIVGDMVGNEHGHRADQYSQGNAYGNTPAALNNMADALDAEADQLEAQAQVKRAEANGLREEASSDGTTFDSTVSTSTTTE